MKPLTRRGKELARLRKENALLQRRLLEYAADPTKGERLFEELARFGITRDSVADIDKRFPSLERRGFYRDIVPEDEYVATVTG